MVDIIPEFTMKKITHSHIPLRTRTIWMMVKSIFTISALIWLCYCVNWSIFFKTLSHLNLSVFFISFGVFMLFIFPCALRWMITAQICGIQLSFKDAVYWYFVGDFFNAFLPSHSGDIVRAVLVGRHYAVPFGTCLVTIFVERFAGVLAAIGFTITASLINLENADQGKHLLVSIVVFMAFSLSVIVMSFIPYFRKIVLNTSARIRIPYLFRFFDDSFRSLDLCRSHPKTMIWVLFFSFLNQMVMIVSGIILGYAIPGFSAPLISFFIVVPLSFFAMLIPSIGGYGIGQVSFIIFFGWFGVKEDPAAVYSILRLFCGTIVSLIGAIGFITGRNAEELQ